MSIRSKLQAALRKTDAMLEPTERDAEIKAAKAKANELRLKAQAQANAIVDEVKAKYKTESPAVKAKLADQLRRLAEKLD